MAKLTRKEDKNAYPKIPTEFEFNRVLQKLEKAIDVEEKESDGSFNDFIRNCDFGGREGGFGKFLYQELGVVGGAYIFVDKANGELLSFYNRNLQKELIEKLESFLGDTETGQDKKRLPFIEIKYQYYHYDKLFYNKPGLNPEIQETRLKEAEKFRNVLDALFIGARERQRIKLNNFPEFYEHRPGFRSEREEKKILRFEKKLNEDGLDIIYCEAGEVLFHLYAWRYLFRLVQLKGIEGKLKKGAKNFEYQRNYSFWEAMSITKNTPEGFWIQYINNSTPKLLEDWQALQKIVDRDPFDEKYGFTFDTEYDLLGLLDKNESDEDRIVSRSFLSLIRYTIHIAEFFLGWKVNINFDPHTEGEFGKSQAEIEDLAANSQCLHTLFVLERRLDIYFQEDNSSRAAFQNFIPTLNKLKEDYNIQQCIDRVIQSYLFCIAEEEEASLFKLIECLHKDCRFPILPYFYEISASDYHLPKEHVVLRIWNSKENKVTFTLDEEEKEDSGIGFVVLTLKPMYKTYYRSNLIIGGKSTHCFSFLSEDAFTRIIRLKTLFRSLARPIIDKVFYGALIKKELERNYFKGYLNSFSHEMSKITDNIFEKSSVSIEGFFKSDTQRFMSAIQPFVKTAPEDFNIENIKNWKVIPNPEIFEIWGVLLRVWSGRRHHQIFPLETNANLKDIIIHCNELAIKLNTGIEELGGESRNSVEAVIEFKKEFERKTLETKKEKSVQIMFFEPDLSKLKMIPKRGGLLIEKQNAFLRIMLATIVNIYEHTSGNYSITINRLAGTQKEKDQLLVSFVNPFVRKGKEKPPESLGTKPVLESCLTRLHGELIQFGTIKNSQEMANWKTRFNLKSNEYLWKSEFKFPLRHIFSDD